MKSIDLANQALKKFKEKIFSLDGSKKPIEIREVGTQWEPFGVLEGDRAKRVDIGLNKGYHILYEGPKNGNFPPHVHEVVESGVVVSGVVKYATPDGTVIMKEGDNFKIDAGIWHKFFFVEKSMLFLKYTPSFAEWNARFKS